MRSLNSWSGIARNHVLRSTALWSSDTESTSNRNDTAFDDQPASRGCPENCLRGRRFRLAEPGTGRRRSLVKGVRRLGVRVGNWLTAEQGKRLLEATSTDTLRGKRNRAMLSLLIGCGLRRA